MTQRTDCDAECIGGTWFFVTPEATGYALHMGSRRSWLGCFCLAAALAGGALAARADTTLYRWVDEQGVVHYSDKPVPGAQKVEIANPQTYKAPPAPPSRPVPANRPAPVAPEPQTATITSPTDGELVLNTGGHISAIAAVNPGLTNGEEVWFILDGNRQPEPAGGLSASFDVDLGQHTLAVVVTDAKGSEVVTSDVVTFLVRQNSILAPPRGPLVPSKPK